MIRILVTGVGSLIGQGILKSIQHSKLDCNVTGTDYFPSAVGLYWVDNRYILPDLIKPEISESQWVEALVNIINKEDIDLILPGLDFEIPVLAKNKSIIENQTEALLLVSSEEVVKIGNDKWETVNFLKNNSFNYPNSSLPENMESFIRSNPFPLIVKPRFGHTSENVFLVKNKKDLDIAIKKCDKPIIQEFLRHSDREYTCGTTCIDNEVITLISLRRVLKNGNTQQAFCEQTEEIDAYIKKLTLSLNPFGAINFQLRITSRGPVVFEINPRFSGTTPIRAIFGINEVEAMVNKLTGSLLEKNFKEKNGVVIRYLEDQFIPWNKYKATSS